MPFKLGPLELLLILIVLVIYFVPTMLAFALHKPKRNLILLINLLLGWTTIGWVVAFVMVFVNFNNATPVNESALETAKQRYAKGEISQAEFEEIKKNIS
jgi:uncharacterized membrane protein